MLLSHLSGFVVSFTLQAVNKRMKKQGAQRTHDIPAGYDDDPFEFVINSPTPVAWIMDVDSTKISIGASHTTLSGKNVKSHSIQSITSNVTDQ